MGRAKDKTKTAQENTGTVCPHCGAGGNGTLGLMWEGYERCWRCIVCGYRSYPVSEDYSASRT